MKKFLTLILSAIMLFSVSGIAVIATDNTPEAMIGENAFATMQMAVNAIQNGTASGII